MFACIIALFQYFCSMYSFTCDYTEGAHPEILRALTETNMQQEPGYGEDSFCASAKKRIREAAGCPDADIFFLVGGTQTNSTVIDGLLEGCQGVLAIQTGHIAIHEAGAIEFCGHKVLTLPQHQGKMDAGELKAWLDWYISHSQPNTEPYIPVRSLKGSEMSASSTVCHCSSTEPVSDMVWPARQRM